MSSSMQTASTEGFPQRLRRRVRGAFLARMAVLWLAAACWPGGASAAQWGDFQDNGCTAIGTRTFASRIWGIPFGRSWDAACKAAAATIQGHFFATPGRCINKGIFGEWGEWDLADDSCFASCRYILFDPPAARPMVGIAATRSGSGYWLVGADGGVFSFGDAQFFGSMGGQRLNKPIVGITKTPAGNGYWLVAADGGVFAFGDAPFLGSLGGRTPSSPIVGMASNPNGRGYWLVAANGTVNGFGDAPVFAGPAARSASGTVSIASTPSGRGYWLFDASGDVRPFGDARSLGSLLGRAPARPVVGAAGTQSGAGYVLAAGDSSVFAFGDARFQGSCAKRTLVFPLVGIAPTPSSQGYWLVDANGGVYPFGDATVGIAATQGGQSPPRMSYGNSASVIFDGGPLFRDITAAIRGARKSVNIMQLFFDTDFISEFGIDDNAHLVDELVAASARGVAVRILLDKKVLSATSGTTALIKAFREKGAGAIAVRDFPLWEPDRLHSKAVVVDGATAYIMGATLQQEMYDERNHPVDDTGHRAGKEPLHTESLKFNGPAVADVDNFFAEFWNRLDTKYFNGRDQLASTPAPVATGKQAVQIVRTIPPAIGVGPATGEIEILEAYQRAFANARRFIYVEHQYLLFRPILEAIRSAMDRNPGLQVIALLNQNPDQGQFMYREWQDRAIHDILGGPGPRLGIFSLWSLGTELAGKTPIRRTYMEGKLAIVDDVWMTLGTANLDGMSMASFETDDNRAPPAALMLLRSLMDTKRSAELNGVIFEGVAGAPHTGLVARTRCDAWTEHLGTKGSDSCISGMPSEGWLPMWTALAQANVNSLNASRPSMNGRILPWVPGGMAEAASQLHALGVNMQKLDVRQD